MIQAAVVGGAGYVGIELVRYLLVHPKINPLIITSNTEKGRSLVELYPALTGKTKLIFSEVNTAEIINNCDIVFLAVPHTKALELVPELLLAGVKVIDLSADYRIKDANIYEQWYDHKHTSSELLDKAVYGQPELHRLELEALKNANQLKESPVLVASAGCYPTASLLAIAPALKAGLVQGLQPQIIINALSGVSGAGKGLKSTSQYCCADEAVMAYSSASHRHTPEIDQELSLLANSNIHATFTPHLIPMKRGLLSTVNAQLIDGVSITDVSSIYEETYAKELFVHFTRRRMPSTNEVVGTNNAHVGIAIDAANNSLVASCAIDNLGKGAASQAIQCANIILDIEEGAGLNDATPIV